MARKRIAIVGAGFSGLSAGLELAQRGHDVTLLERDASIGGLAGSFDVGGVQLEKFYHHWFTNDRHVMDLVADLNLNDRVRLRDSRTGMYYANRIFRLSRPLDLLTFAPLKPVDRLRLGLLMLKAKRVRDWRALEDLTAQEWLIQLCGEAVYRVVWDPLLKGKFGADASSVSAVWFWNKLVLRGGSRGKSGAEQLAYFQGGFSALAEAVAARISAAGGSIRVDTTVNELAVLEGRAAGVSTSSGFVPSDAVILTQSLPGIADLLEPHVSATALERLRAVRYLANICIVLDVKRSLSDTYWLNVNDPTFPFVGVIEHTNFEPPASYGGRHIVYLSKYLPQADPLYRMNDEAVYRYALPYVRRIFPEFGEDWVNRFYIWRAPHAQPLVVRNYSKIVPPAQSEIPNVFICTMAQIYPEDRGTNYAIREGRAIGRFVAERL